MRKILPLIVFLALAVSGRAQSVPGGDMESWSNYAPAYATMYRPTGWSSSDSLIRFVKALTSPGTPYTPRVTQSTAEKHGGTSSAQLVSNSHCERKHQD